MQNANTAAVPVQEYRVVTDAGRNFIWSATDMKDLFRQLTDSGHRATFVELYKKEESA